MSDYFDLLGRQQNSATPVRGETLEHYGKCAADLFRSGKVANLSQGVVAVVKTAALSPEQVRRVVEFANHDHYIYSHRKLAGEHRIVDFGDVIADPGEVLRDLNDGGNPPAPAADFSRLDYHKPPMQKEASGLPFDLAAIEPEEPQVDHIAELRGLQSKMASARKQLDYERDRTDRALGIAFDEFVEHVKTALLEGYTMGDVIAAVAEGGATAEGVHAVMPRVGSELLKQGSFHDGLEMTESFEKRASYGVARTTHPLVQSYQMLQDLALKVAQYDDARGYLFEREEKIAAFLKHGNRKGIIPRMYELAGHAAERAAPVAEGATRALLGDLTPHAKDVGTVVRGALKHLPTAGLLIGANELRRRVGSSPAVQSVMATVPGTQEYDQRNMQLAMQNQGYY